MFSFYLTGGTIRDQLLKVAGSAIHEYLAVLDEDLFKINTPVDTVFASLQIYFEKQGYSIIESDEQKFTLFVKFPREHTNRGICATFVLSTKEVPFDDEIQVVPASLYDYLCRRDFTINAIAKSEDGKIIDPFSGRKDIQQKMLNTPISAKVTFMDDPSRLVSAIKYAIVYGFEISNEIKSSLKYFDYWKNLNKIKPESLLKELEETFKFNTLETLLYLEQYKNMREFLFKKSNFWLKPVNKK